MVPNPTRNKKREWRMVIDYRGLNKVTTLDRYRILSMLDLYMKLRRDLYPILSTRRFVADCPVFGLGQKGGGHRRFVLMDEPPGSSK